MAGITSLATSLVSTLQQKKGNLYLTELLEPADKIGPTLYFQYFPATISDNKQSGWNSRRIPGGSLPIYHWVSSGARTISFAAVFTTDVDLANADPTSSQAIQASSAKLATLGLTPKNIDIRAAILWLRRFEYPRYPQAAASQQYNVTPPRKLYLIIPNSGIGLAGCGTLGADTVLCVMTSCDVTWNSFFPSNLPRMATVNLSFEEVPQLNGTVTFPTPTHSMDYLGGGIVGDESAGDNLVGGTTNTPDVGTFVVQYPFRK